MAYHNTLFPPALSYSSASGPGFLTHLVTKDSGQIEAVARWSRPRRHYDVSHSIKGYAALQTLRDFYVARLGPANTFPFKDPMDFSTNPAVTAQNWNSTGGASTVAPTNTDVLLGTGDGTTTAFQLRKGYTSGGQTVYVPITKPIAATVVASLDAVSSSAWTLNDQTGVLTFNTAPGAGVLVRAGCEFYIPVRFAAELDQGFLVDMEAFSIGNLRSIPLIEDIDGSTVNEDYLPMGGQQVAFSQNLTITQVSYGRCLSLVPGGAGLTVTIEDAVIMPSGGPHYSIVNNGGNSFTLKGGSTTIATISAGADVVLNIWKVGGVNTWKAATA